MLNRAFTKREKVLLLALVMILLGLVYYRFVRLPVQDRIAAADTTLLEQQMSAEQQKASIIKQMQEDIEAGKKDVTGIVASYDNLKAESAALNTIFSEATSFNFSFEQPVATDDAVRRTINISFTATNYQIARRIIQQVHDCAYRCLITDISVSADENGGAEAGDKMSQYPNLANATISGSMSVTFYETLNGATTTNGLTTSDGSAVQSSGGLARSYLDLAQSDLETMAESLAGNAADQIASAAGY